jgi:ABC-2 type transport system ATP-binding protein
MDMTALEYLRFVSELKGVEKAGRTKHIAEVMKLVRITNVANRLIKNLSKGYKQRVGIAQALIGNPEVLVLDEPTVGLDPKQIIEIRQLIRSLGKNHTIILSSHILPEVSAICDRIVIISNGSIAAVDSTENLTKQFKKMTRVQIAVVGPTKEILQKIRMISGVKHADVAGEKVDDINLVAFENNPETDVRKQVFFEMARNSWPIIEMKSLDPTLEDIFLQATSAGGTIKKGDA